MLGSWLLVGIALGQTVAFEAPLDSTRLSVVEARPALPDGRTGLIVRELCVAPCSVALEAGTYEFLASAPGERTSAQRFDVGVDGLVLRAARNPVRRTGFGMIGIGLATAAIGGVGYGLNGVDGGAETALGGAFVGGLSLAAIGVPLTALGSGRLLQDR